nr:DUF2147 domain-containing protein [uncultured Brumimicrobium sp.]
MLKYFLIFLFGMIALSSTAQAIEGTWESYDDSSGELKAEVKIYLKNGKLYGKIVALHNLKIALKDAKCYYCTDYRKNQDVLGMEIMTALVKSGDEWSGKKALLDPNNGKLYDAKLWLVNEDQLAVRGYIGWFFRTQYWIRKK